MIPKHSFKSFVYFLMKKVFHFLLILLFATFASSFAWHHIFHEKLKNSFEIKFSSNKKSSEIKENCRLCLNIFIDFAKIKRLNFIDFFYYLPNEIYQFFHYEKIINNVVRGPPLKK